MHRAGLRSIVASLLASLLACHTHPPRSEAPVASGAAGGGHAVSPASAEAYTHEPSRLQRELAALSPVAPLPDTDAQRTLASRIDDYFRAARTRRMYVGVDKPLYREGEAIWFRAFELGTADLINASQDNTGITFRLISPKGAVVQEKRVKVERGVATNDFPLPPGVPGGEYVVQATSDAGAFGERIVMVSSYQPPQIKKKLEFLRKAYGAGDRVAAAVALHRGTGEPLAAHPATAIAIIDGAEVARVPVRTDPAGKVTVQFELPGRIARGDGLLTLLVEDGGVTESIQKRIPIALDRIDFAMFPEGGDLVTGLPGRVYFAAKNPIGKPADVEGRVVDDTGAVVARFVSLHDGMGRFELTPKTGRSYKAIIDRPAGIDGAIALPAAKADGCALQAIDDFEGRGANLRVAVWCSEAQTVVATSMLREQRLGAAAVDVAKDAPAVIALPAPPTRQGAVRVTLFDDALRPLAERLIYRGLGADLQLSVRAEREGYAPRDQVTLAIEARDLAGKPVQADLALAVVDDTVLSFADDKKAHLLASLYLESEMPGQEIEEPNFYFSDEPKAAPALDLVLGTQGWRRFAWEPVLNPQPVYTDGAAYGRGAMGDDRVALEEAEAMPADAPRAALPPRAPMRPQAQQARPMAPPPAMAEPMPAELAPPMDLADGAGRRARRQAGAVRDGRWMADKDEDWAGVLGAEAKLAQNAHAWTPVREFPAPTYEERYDGPRVDFRETIHWAPSVTTGRDGKARVRFYLSDAVTSFRATVEGVSAGGLPGRADALIQSRLPVSLMVKMPVEVSAGDRLALPVTLANETGRAYVATVDATFGPAFKVVGGVPRRVRLAGGERKAYFYQLEVVGDGKDPAAGKIAVVAEAANLRDEVERTIDVVPLGFPQELSVAGTVDGVARHEIELAGALPNSIEATLTLYPSPLATMTAGTEAIIREPYGCFEQASSANYPNIMVLSYLEEHDAADPDLVARTHAMLDSGYQKLTGYESPNQGYEWFGGDPGHEALTAYGLMEFADMTEVYDDVDRQMIERTRAWLLARRDGKGGFTRNARALDSFGRASEEVTNGYITYALAETGATGLERELAYQQRIAERTDDPYLLALATNTMLRLAPTAAATRAAVRKLAGKQTADGSFAGADHSITRSGGKALDIETTSLAALALLRAGNEQLGRVRDAVAWLDGQRDGWGGYGSTQSTVLALKALTAYAEASKVTRAAGNATLYINGKQAGRVAFEAGEKDPLVFDDVASVLRRGTNTIELRLDSKQPLPYSMAVTWRSKQPASSPETRVAVDTRLASAKVPWGESVRMRVDLRNLTGEGIPMTLARVGIPGGLAFQTWQLDELKDKGLIDFYETRDREVVLYFRSMAPNAEAHIDLDLLAAVPGSFVAPASSAYLYYTDEHKHWSEPVRISVER